MFWHVVIPRLIRTECGWCPYIVLFPAPMPASQSLAVSGPQPLVEEGFAFQFIPPPWYLIARSKPDLTPEQLVKIEERYRKSYERAVLEHNDEVEVFREEREANQRAEEERVRAEAAQHAEEERLAEEAVRCAEEERLAEIVRQQVPDEPAPVVKKPKGKQAKPARSSSAAMESGPGWTAAPVSSGIVPPAEGC
jgi:hypothetical protein